MVFSQAAPGLSGALLKTKLIDRLASADSHPGKLLHYLPDAPARDPIAAESCAPVPMPVARTMHSFKLDSDRQIARVSAATVSLNGQLIATEAEQLVGHMNLLVQSGGIVDDWPRDVVVELTTRRATRALFRPGTHLQTDRRDMTVAEAARMFDELGLCDDVRLTLCGVGDPLLAPDALSIIAAAKDAGIAAVHVDTDLIELTDSHADGLVRSGVDVVSVHLPAIQPVTYSGIMGVGAYEAVVANLKLLLAARKRHGRTTPIVVPTFTKCPLNLAEMEPWYDQWLRVLGAAVISGPGDFAGQIPDHAVADMSPPRRQPCRRLGSRMTVLSDGRVVICEQDVLGRQSVGSIGEESIRAVWSRLRAIRSDHEQGLWDRHALCRTCREWHRP
jgi:spiro-SPASM protein